MKKFTGVILTCFIISLCVSESGLAAEQKMADLPFTISDCYNLALKQSELIAINADQIKETEARFLQALSIIVPHASFQSTDTQESIPNDAGTTLSTLKPARSSLRNFNFTQTLFSGFKAFAAIRASRLEKDQRIEEKRRAEQLLLIDVSNSFYLLIEKKDDLNSLIRIKKALIDRVKELRDRERLGRSRTSEVVNAKTQLYNVEATIELVKNQEVIARQILEFLVGVPVSEVNDSYGFPSYLMPEEYYVSQYLSRPDVKAARYAWQYAKKQREVIDSEFLPTVDLEGNYYVQRTGFNKGTDWDIMLSVNVPIFEGTETLGRSKEFTLKAHESELLYQRTKRKAPYDIKDAYVRLNTAMIVHDALKKAYKSARLNYYLQKKDYSRSLVSNLDVLAAIQTLENAERDYIHALYEAKRAYWVLRVAAGQSIAEDLYDTF